MSKTERIINTIFTTLSIPTNDNKSGVGVMNDFPIMTLELRANGHVGAFFDGMRVASYRESTEVVSQREFDAVANLVEAIVGKDDRKEHKDVTSIEAWLGLDLSVFIRTKDNGFRSLVDIS